MVVLATLHSLRRHELFSLAKMQIAHDGAGLILPNFMLYIIDYSRGRAEWHPEETDVRRSPGHEGLQQRGELCYGAKQIT